MKMYLFLSVTVLLHSLNMTDTCSPSDLSSASPLDDSLKDLTDVAPSRKRRFRHLRAPNAAVKRLNPQSSQRQRYKQPNHMEYHLQASL